MFGSAQKHAFLSQTCCLYWAFLAHLSVKSSWVKTALRWHYFLEIPPNKQWNVPRMNFENLPKFTLTFLGSFLTHFCWRLLEDLLLEISSISIDVKILSVSSLISFQSLKFMELTLRLKCRFWKMSMGQFKGRLCASKMIFCHFLIMLFYFPSVKKKISGTLAGCHLSLPEQNHPVSVLKSAQNCSSASGSPWFPKGPYCEQELNFGTWKSWSRVHQLPSSLLD